MDMVVRDAILVFLLLCRCISGGLMCSPTDGFTPAFMQKISQIYFCFLCLMLSDLKVIQNTQGLMEFMLIFLALRFPIETD